MNTETLTNQVGVTGLAMLGVGIGMLSIPWALIVVGGLLTAGATYSAFNTPDTPTNDTTEDG